MNKKQLKQRRQHYLQLIHQDHNSTQTAQIVGVSKRTGKVWRNGRPRTTGRNESPSIDGYRGDMPAPTPLHHHRRYLSEAERLTIADLLHHDQSLRAIATELGRSPSTTSRELRRNIPPQTTEYRPYRADQLAKARQARPKTPKILLTPQLFERVRQKLAQHWSPEQISAWLHREFPDNETMYLCPETIYQAIYIQAKGQLKLEVKKALRTGRVRRKPHTLDQHVLAVSESL